MTALWEPAKKPVKNRLGNIIAAQQAKDSIYCIQHPIGTAADPSRIPNQSKQRIVGQQHRQREQPRQDPHKLLSAPARRSRLRFFHAYIEGEKSDQNINAEICLRMGKICQPDHSQHDFQYGKYLFPKGIPSYLHTLPPFYFQGYSE